MYRRHATLLVIGLLAWVTSGRPAFAVAPVTVCEREAIRDAKAALRLQHRDAVRAVNEQLRLHGACDPHVRQCLLRERAAITGQYHDQRRQLNQALVRGVVARPVIVAPPMIVAPSRPSASRQVLWSFPVGRGAPSTTVLIPATPAPRAGSTVIPATAEMASPAGQAPQGIVQPATPATGPLRLLPIPDAEPARRQTPEGPQPTPARRPPPEATIEPLPTPAAARKQEPTLAQPR